MTSPAVVLYLATSPDDASTPRHSAARTLKVKWPEVSLQLVISCQRGLAVDTETDAIVTSVISSASERMFNGLGIEGSHGPRNRDREGGGTGRDLPLRAP